MESEILAKVIRGETVESIHRGHLIVIDGDGQDAFQFGQSGNRDVFSLVGKAFSGVSVFDERRG